MGDPQHHRFPYQVMIIYDLDDFFRGHNSIHKFIDLTADESKPIVTIFGNNHALTSYFRVPRVPGF